MESMNVIFLDMDGVINCSDFVEQHFSMQGSRKEQIDSFMEKYTMHNGLSGFIVPELVERFNSLCEKTNAGIVWSSSWRINYENDDGSFNYDNIEQLWNAKGLPFKRLIGCTDIIDMHRYSYVPRHIEISKWLKDNERKYNICRAVILDDDVDAWDMDYIDMNNVLFLQTMYNTGLTEDIALKAERWLNEGIELI